MTSKRVSAPFDLMKELDSDDDTPKKQSTLTTQQTLVGTQPPPKAAISKQCISAGIKSARLNIHNHRQKTAKTVGYFRWG